MEPEMASRQKPKAHPNTRLRHQREQQNLTLQEIADKLYDMCIQEGRESGISADTVGRWERGVSKPEAHYRAKLCKLFGKSAAELGLIEQPVPCPETSLVPFPSSLFDGACYNGTYLQRVQHHFLREEEPQQSSRKFQRYCFALIQQLISSCTRRMPHQKSDSEHCSPWKPMI